MDRPQDTGKEVISIVISTGFFYPACSARRGTLLYRTEALPLLGGKSQLSEDWGFGFSTQRRAR
jgi:hypothetical protein